MPRGESRENVGSYLRRVAEALGPDALDTTPVKGLVSARHGIQPPDGMSLRDLMTEDTQAPGEDRMDQIVRTQAELVKKGEVTLRMAMAHVTAKGASNRHQEKLLMAIPGGLQLAARWSHLTAQEKVAETGVWDRVS
ncbi:hypothetical protein AMECASPLE_002395, partial [Ameca splendens]